MAQNATTSDGTACQCRSSRQQFPASRIAYTCKGPRRNDRASVRSIGCSGWCSQVPGQTWLRRCQACGSRGVESRSEESHRRRGGRRRGIGPRPAPPQWRRTAAGGLGKRSVLEVRQPVITEAEAKRRVEAILNDHAKKFLTGEADGIGLPSPLPDRNITMTNPGEPFSKTYCIQ